MKNEKKKQNDNYEPGRRLYSCIKKKGLKEGTFAEKVNYTEKYISDLVVGRKKIDWNKAVLFADILDVNPAYIMCETDIIRKGKEYIPTDLQSFGAQDNLFLQFLMAAGHSIVFHVVKLYDGKLPDIKKINSKAFGKRTITDWKSLQIDVELSDLQNMCLSDPRCKYIDGDYTSEVIIQDVSFNGIRLSFGRFVFIINRLYDYMQFTLANIKEFMDDLDYLLSGTDISVQEEIKETRDLKGGTFDIQECIDTINKEYGKVVAKIIDEDELSKL